MLDAERHVDSHAEAQDLYLLVLGIRSTEVA